MPLGSSHTGAANDVSSGIFKQNTIVMNPKNVLKCSA